jgi:hypothetical protein
MRKTRAMRLEYDFVTSKGRLYLNPNRDDSPGCIIQLFEEIDPNVIFISVIIGDRDDTYFCRNADGSWLADCPGPKPDDEG